MEGDDGQQTVPTSLKRTNERKEREDREERREADGQPAKKKVMKKWDTRPD
jgi:hypothetical protein